jgi:hypothetical protein
MDTEQLSTMRIVSHSAARSANPFDVSVDVYAFGVGIEVFEGTRLYSCAADEAINFLLLQSNYPTKFVGGELALIDELVKGAQRHPKARGGVVGGEPANLVGGHPHTLPHFN